MSGDEIDGEESDSQTLPDTVEAGRPRVILCTLDDLGDVVPASARATLGQFAVWFLRGEDAGPMTIFDRIPEPDASEDVDAAMEAVASVSRSAEESIQRIVGGADEIELGFHAGATLAQAREVFVDDGYEVIDPEHPLPEGVVWPSELARWS